MEINQSELYHCKLESVGHTLNGAGVYYGIIEYYHCKLSLV